MTRQALLAADGLLKAHGFCTFLPTAGETVQDVAESFALEPGKHRWDGAKWVAVTLTPPDPADITKAEKLLKAACLYFGQQLGKTPAQVRDGIKTIYESL